MSNQELLTARELASRLAVQPSTIRKWVRQGRIPEVVLSPKVRRFDYAAVVEALKHGHGTPCDRQPQTTEPKQ